MPNVAIRFLKHHLKQDEHVGTPDETRYRAGQILVCREDTARHYERRGIAERAAAPGKEAARQGTALELPAPQAGGAPGILPSSSGDAGKADASKAETDKAGADSNTDAGKADAGAGRGRK